MHRIVYLEAAALPVAIRRPAFAHQWTEYPDTAPAEIIPRLAAASIAIVNKRRVDAAAIKELPALRLIAIAATGYNNVDIEACRARGIVVCNVRGYARDTVPEHVFALLLALSRQLLPYHQSVAAGRWQQSEQFCYFDYPIRDLKGQTLGLVGGGVLGQGVARLAVAFGMQVVHAERKGASVVRPGHVPFAEVLRAADVISLHCPLTADTRHLIGAAELAAMRPHALLINTARGGLVDEEALAAALSRRQIGGAGFDVLSEEPPGENPLLAPALLAAGNFILTPHVAWSSRDAMEALSAQLSANLEAFAAGRPHNRVG